MNSSNNSNGYFFKISYRVQPVCNAKEQQPPFLAQEISRTMRDIFLIA